MESQATLRLYDGYKGTSPSLRPLVLRLQKLLRQNGEQIKPDGFFGRSTEMAVERFQKAQGLTVDGIVGRDTWLALAGEMISAPTGDTMPTTYLRENARLRSDNMMAERYRSIIEAVAKRHDLAPALVAAIGSRESRWGIALSPKGPAGKGDHGHGRGLMQIDDRFHEFALSGRWQDPEANLEYGCALLVAYYHELGQTTKLPQGPVLMRAALAGYNSGCGNVRKALRNGRDVDYYTSGRDYSADVLNRAGWFRREGW